MRIDHLFIPYNSFEMVKKIAYALLGVLALLVLVGTIGISYFHAMWFKEKPNDLVTTLNSDPITFQWASQAYGDYIEPYNAIIIPVRIQNLPNRFYVQFDTGAPSTLIYGHSIQSLKAAGIDITDIVKDEKRYIQQLDFLLGGNPVQASMIQIIENYGNSFDPTDTTSKIKIGTLGADFFDNRIASIDFKQECIHIYDERPESMESLPAFLPFSFKGRRMMFPATIGGKSLDLFYDSGSSAFGLITTKNRYNKLADDGTTIHYDANSWGDALSIMHKNTKEEMEIGNAHLEVKRVSYVDKYASVQRFIAPFSKIGGWLGNMPFTESTLIVDTKREEFLIIDSP